jgi:hypothetical protein
MHAAGSFSQALPLTEAAAPCKEVIMGAIDHSGFHRVLLQSAEIAAEVGMTAEVVRAYRGVLQPAAEPYLAAHSAVKRAEAEFREDNEDALHALDALDAPYRQARSAALASAPTLALPEALRSQPTDGEKFDALEQLLDALDDHSDEAWADELAHGAFARRAAALLRALDEAIAASTELSAAREARAGAYGPAHERYLRFKRVVRETLGAHSLPYKRIHLGAVGPREDVAPATVPEPAIQRSTYGGRMAPRSDRHRGRRALTS